MGKNNNYKKFLKNYLIWPWWTLVVLLAAASGIFALVSFPLWSIIFVGSVALVLFIIVLIKATALRYKVDGTGITVPTAVFKKKVVAFADIDGVMIRSIKTYIKSEPIYIIKFTSGIFTINIKTLRSTLDAIIEFGKDCKNLQIMIAESLKDAEQ